ncbi:MAG: PAS domain-containing protein, partial [Bacteroidetes bacterium]|nr:PAS domain-containing protein [Bacteroidota bacterium]
KAAEEKLIESEGKLKQSNIFIDSILENIPNMIFVKDAKDLRFLRFNKAGEELIGYSRTDLIGKNDYDFFPKEQADSFTAKDREVFLQKEIVDIPEEPIDTRLKGKRWLHTQKITIKDDTGSPAYLLGISEDITERKAAEDLLKQKSEELKKTIEQLDLSVKEMESFSYSVSHDLRSPVRAINSFTNLLKKNYNDKFDEKGKDLLNIITSEALRMGQLIDDLLAFSRLGKKEIQKLTIDMNLLVKEVVDEVLKLAEEKYKAKIKIMDLPPANGDIALIRQVFVNLISNALKFSNLKAEPLVEIGSKSENNEIIYYIKDNGAGFDMKFYDKLFGVFQRLHSAEDFKGTGIGLAIAKRIITSHGGRIWAEGKVNEGATFYFSLPK